MKPGPNDYIVLDDCTFYCETHGHVLDNEPHLDCSPPDPRGPWPLVIERERRSAFQAAQDAVRLLSPRSKAISTIGRMIARADAAIDALTSEEAHRG